VSPTILVIIGPSGTGKSTLARNLEERGLIQITKTWTTRPSRADETGTEHRFVNEIDFAKHEAKGGFLATVAPFGLTHRYGLPPAAIPSPPTVPSVLLRAPLVPLFARHYPNYKVYQIEDDYSVVADRLNQRAILGEELGSRLQDFHDERALGRSLADRIITNNQDLEAMIQHASRLLEEDFPTNA
jgi:guanylate kinase